MSDNISRADAIEAVAQQWLFEASVGNPYVNDDDIGEYRKLAEELFEDVPSAEAVKGEWICKGDYAVCSKCGGSSGTQFDGVEPIPKTTAFCPNCGARMKGGDDE